MSTESSTRNLAAATDLDPNQISRLVARLREEPLIKTDEAGRVALNDELPEVAWRHSVDFVEQEKGANVGSCVRTAATSCKPLEKPTASCACIRGRRYLPPRAWTSVCEPSVNSTSMTFAVATCTRPRPNLGCSSSSPTANVRLAA